MTFVDTNYFLRFLLADNTEQHHKAVDLFTAGANNQLQLVSSEIVFFELFWVFSSFYKKTKKEIIEILQSVLSLTFIEFTQREVLDEALALYKKENIELEDCYNLAFAFKNDVKAFKTFDKKLQKVVFKSNLSS